MKQILIFIVTLIIITLAVIIIRPQLHNEVKIVNTELSFFTTKETPRPAAKTKFVPQKTTSGQNVNVKTVGSAVSNKAVSVNTESETSKASAKFAAVPQKHQQTKVQTQQNSGSSKIAKPYIPVKTAQQVSTPTVQTSSGSNSAAQTNEEQEAISWNRWRANVHNNIISRVNLPVVPVGTVFSYSFTVSEDGAISNVRTSSVSPQYTAYAIQYIAPVVRQSAHSSFLKFPSGTNRQSVNVQYKFRTTDSGAGSQASASNFNDVEVIKR